MKVREPTGSTSVAGRDVGPADIEENWAQDSLPRPINCFPIAIVPRLYAIVRQHACTRPRSPPLLSAPISFDLTLDRRCCRIFALDPIARATGAVARGLALRHDAPSQLVTADPLFNNRRAQVLSLAGRYSLPAIYQWREFVTSGGLMSYGPAITEAYRHASKGRQTRRYSSGATYKIPVSH